MSVTLLPVSKPRILHRPYMALAGLQVLDVLTTGLLLDWYTHTHEGNPIARQLTDHGHVGLALLLAFKLTTVGLVWWCQTGVRLVGALYSLVIFNNVLALYLLTFG